MSPKVAVFGTLRFPPERIPDLLPHIRALVEATHKHDGCIAYDVAQDLFEPGVIRVSELWPDRESLARHSKAPHVPPWREASRACGLLERKFMVYEISGESPL